MEKTENDTQQVKATFLIIAEVGQIGFVIDQKHNLEEARRFADEFTESFRHIRPYSEREGPILKFLEQAKFPTYNINGYPLIIDRVVGGSSDGMLSVWVI